MAHFIPEYSANLPKQKLALKDLFKKLHEVAAATGIYPLPGLRSRAHCAEDFWVADGNPEFAFIHLNFRIGPGRTDAEKFKLLTPYGMCYWNIWINFTRARASPCRLK